MSSRGLRQEEADAGSVLAAVLGGTWEGRDVHATSRTPDIAVLMPDGRAIIVEVTLVINERRQKRNQAAFKRFPPDDRLLRDWMVVLQDKHSSRFDKTIPRLVEALQVLESDGVSHAGINWLHERWPPQPELPTPGTDSATARDTLRDLDVELARSPSERSDPNGGQVELAFVVPPGASYWDLSTLVAERVAAKRTKLLNAVADARHLFVWLDQTEPEAYLAAVTSDARIPRFILPTGVDVVWVATRYFPGFTSADVGGVSVQRLLQITRSGMWETVPLDRFGSR